MTDGHAPAQPDPQPGPIVSATGPITLTVALLAFALTAWQGVADLAGRPLLGCGPGSACGLARTSRFGELLGLPIAIWAAALYALATLRLLTRGPQRGDWTPRAMAWTVIAAAFGYSTAQWFAVGGLCPWCVVSHAVGLVWAGCVLWATRRTRWDEAKPAQRMRLPAWVVGVTAVAVAILIQARSEPSAGYEIGDRVRVSAPGVAATDRARGEGAGGRTVWVIDAEDRPGLRFDIAPWPRLGPLDAPEVGVFLFDYHCRFCRGMHAVITEARRAHPESFAVVMLPAPGAHRDVDPDGTNAAAQSKADGRVPARLALALWQVSPESFQAWDAAVMSLPFPPSGEAALAQARALTGLSGEELRRLAEAPAIDAALARVAAFQSLSGHTLIPRLLLSAGSWTGGVVDEASARALRDLIDRSLSRASRRDEPPRENPP